ncbi:hypothetical protein [Burkholderia ubonensis]|uniref:hypothetical protein n=1 Tax=Burkholderia ubonensis TaxID=101571 RepID=UPI0007C87A36|nr:hypothetical protein [Burkholderia ubonensis]
MPTLQLSEKTWATLQAADERNFVATVRDDIVRDYPAVADDPTLLERLNAAYAWAKEHGFTHDGPIVEFLDVEARTPGFYKTPPVATWLNKPGVSGEQRFEILMQATRKRQQEMKGNH